MADCGCKPTPATTREQRSTLWIALWLNAAMFLVETATGWFGNSTSLLADGLDMLSDACVYAIALAAIGRGDRFQALAATTSAWALSFLGLGVLFDVIRRLFTGGEPQGAWMIAVSCLALAVNVTVMRLLARHRDGGVHMRAAWIFTRADVIANAAVIVSGGAVMLTGMRYFDLVVGAAIGLYVLREAAEILKEARAARLGAGTCSAQRPVS
ncbi:cation diffusion facilitator family transporter [Novosphingobium mangrovi (ex Huang et al. 2023)]|uniref:Cation diffusion facilitator family transporter n=1 Tax=Novosphingobium mangrovi (ex Huang et al. 2023) TaxID=2976432 RepID=A0ABT2I9V2_9SPHN|nr:cation diffusion facilitator family transporter [Novosphingobium mangrovi (ex Huang et al. 2023)]MCT2401610.1 cation diffusion facilitator family transporter [Novosphingobium mangrovi (ex Huang et al. 2023)]